MWAEKEELVEYAIRCGFDNPQSYADDVILYIDGLMKGDASIPKIIADGGPDSGKFIFEAWGSVEVVDKDNQLIPVKDILRVMPYLIKRGGNLMFGHSNQGIGQVEDFWLEEYKGEKIKGVQGIKFRASIHDDFKSDHDARDGILKGDYRMVSLGGKSHRGIQGFSSDGTPMEILKDLEVWEFSLVRKGKNPLAYITRVNGIEIHKGDDEHLWKDDSFMRTVHSLLLEGVHFKDAWDGAKKIITGSVTRPRNEFVSTSINKGERNMPDEKSIEERVALLEKGMADLAKGTEEFGKTLKSMSASFTERLDALKKSLDIPAETPDNNGPPNPPAPITKGDQGSGQGIDYEKLDALMKKGLKEQLEEMGFVNKGVPAPPSTPAPPSPEGNVNKGITEPANPVEQFKENYLKMMSQAINKGSSAKTEMSFEEMGAALQGIPDTKEG